MSKLEQFDQNFKVDASIDKNGLFFYNAKEDPFSVHGVFEENGRFRRIPEKVARTVSEGVLAFHAHTAGGRVRFRTNSKRIAISAQMDHVSNTTYGAITGYCGFDLYENGIYKNTFIPPHGITNGYESVYSFDSCCMREITINMPTYSDVVELYIGLDEDAEVEAPNPYSITAPIVYYGSSITQGGCASRPGVTYQGYIERRFDCDYVNLGFSGSARAEEAIVKYISELNMGVFVLDYDANAPTPEYLEKTHKKMYQAVRMSHKDIPIIILSFPRYTTDSIFTKRMEIIKKTYQDAVSSGDRNVYFISGRELMKYAKDEGTIDNCHPNDLGFASMAKVLGDFIEKEIFAKK